MNKTESEPKFDKNEISNLLFLEENFIKKPNSELIVQNLVEQYAKLIEYYDSIKDPIKLYFMDKM